MFMLNFWIFLAGILLLLGILSSKFSARLGVPVLVFFLGVGMLAGSEGIGNIPFEDYSLANGIGSVALALILFDGGLQTTLASVRNVWKLSLSLATVGVFLTSLLTGLAAAWILDVPLLQGMLLGSIVGSTDAAAVFSVLRTSGLELPQKLTSTLEVESGSNDPMAIFMTLGIIGIITGTTSSPQALLVLFLAQFGLGGLAGIIVGKLATWVINNINLDYPGLYPLVALSFGLVSFGSAAVLGGSGFLAVYVTGIALGSTSLVFQKGISSFHDTMAWLGQIALFVMLGLLSFPSRLYAVADQGLLIALVLILVARPFAVAVSAFPFQFRRRELFFLSWVGLKGAVPITLATFPLMAGIPHSHLIFNAVFFVVLISAVTQGWSLPLVARWLSIGRPADPAPALSVEINALRRVDGHIVDYTVKPQSRIAGRQIRDLSLPDGVLVTLILRGKQIIMPRGATSFEPGDHVFVALRSGLVPWIDRLFSVAPELIHCPCPMTFLFNKSTRINQVFDFLSLGCNDVDVVVDVQSALGEYFSSFDPRADIRLGSLFLHSGPEDDLIAVTLPLLTR